MRITKALPQISSDKGHQFGLSKPVDLVDELTIELKDKSLIEIKVMNDTADLLLTLTGNKQTPLTSSIRIPSLRLVQL